VLLPWDDLTINSNDARVTLAMSAEQIEALPDFEPIEREMPTAAAPATGTMPATPDAPPAPAQ